MNDAQLLRRLAHEDEFAEGTQLPSTAWSHDEAFQTVQRLVDLTDATPLGRIDFGRRNRNWLAAAAAFVLVALVGVGIAFVSTRGDSTPVDTTATSTTTTTPDTTTPEGSISQQDRLVLDALERAYNRGDGAAVEELLAADADVSLLPSGVTPSIVSVAARTMTGDFYGEDISINDCSVADVAIVCDVEFDDDFSRALGLEPWHQVWTLQIVDGAISRLEVDGDDAARADAMEQFAGFVTERGGVEEPALLAGRLEWNRTPAGQAVYAEHLARFTAVANGVPEASFQLVADFHNALSSGDVAAAEALFAPGGEYHPTEADDELSAAVYSSDDRAGYFTLWYDWFGTDWVPVTCEGDAVTVTCMTESSGLMTLILPGRVAWGQVTYTIGPDGFTSIVDRTVRTGGSGGGTGNGMDLRGFWRSWMPENAPEVELLWPGGNGDPENGFDLEFARAVLEYYPRFLVENAVDVPPEYLVTPDDRTVIDRFVETFNAGDPEVTLSLLSPDAEVVSDQIGGAQRRGEAGDTIDRLFRFYAIQDSRMTIASCAAAEGSEIDCRGTFTDIVVERSTFGEAGLTLTFMVDGEGLVSHLSVNPNSPTMFAAYDFFFNWLDEAHPGDGDILGLVTGGGMSLQEDALELLPIRVEEWIATLEG
jgi:hypothetical protein